MSGNGTRWALASSAAVLLVVAGCDRGDAEDNAVMAQAPEPTANQAAAAEPSGFERMDADADGMVTRAEHAAAASAMFTVMDADRDGMVTPAEMDASQGALGGSTAKSSAEKIAVIDSNGDGQISGEEHAEGSTTMFTKMDTDASGWLIQSEFDAGHKAMLGS
jgi:hypothetical protein